MSQPEILRGKVTGYPSGQKGMVEVALGAFSADGETILARMGQCMAGVYWLPEIGDAVEVALPVRPGGEACIVAVHRQAGDAQTGQCWNAQNDCKQLLTRSGHCITFSDEKEKGKLLRQTAGALSALFDDGAQTITLRGKEEKAPSLVLDMKQGKVELRAEKELTVSCAGASIHIDSHGNITISAAGSLTLKAQEISLEGKQKIQEKAADIKVSAGMAAKVSGQGGLELTSGGITTVKGSMIKLN